MRRLTIILLGAVVALAITAFAAPWPVRSTYPGCDFYEPDPPYEPTGVKGCIVYGVGIATRYEGPGVARNDCLWPWTDCTPITITSIETGISITVQPKMYGDLYTTTWREKIVDLNRAAVSDLGLDWDDGTYDVRVEPASVATLPDTAMGR